MHVHSQRTDQRLPRLSQSLRPAEEWSRHLTMSNRGRRIAVTLLEVMVMDIRCMMDTNPEIGDTLSIEGGRRADLSGVVHWKKLRRHGYEVGVYLPSSLPAGLMDALTDYRRCSNRYRCRQNGQIVMRDASIRSDAINYSSNGVTIQTGVCCDIDDLFTFEWKSGRCLQQISGQVLWQIEQNNGVRLGCQVGPTAGYRIAGLNFTC